MRGFNSRTMDKEGSQSTKRNERIFSYSYLPFTCFGIEFLLASLWVLAMGAFRGVAIFDIYMDWGAFLFEGLPTFVCLVNCLFTLAIFLFYLVDFFIYLKENFKPPERKESGNFVLIQISCNCMYHILVHVTQGFRVSLYFSWLPWLLFSY